MCRAAPKRHTKPPAKQDNQKLTTPLHHKIATPTPTRLPQWHYVFLMLSCCEHTLCTVGVASKWCAHGPCNHGDGRRHAVPPPKNNERRVSALDAAAPIEEET